MNREPLPNEALDQYPEAIVKAREVARQHGYALAVHGSQTYDLDLIACPWVENCSLPLELATAIAIELSWYLHPDVTTRAHGRKAYLIYGTRSAHIDLSIMPKSPL